MGIVFPFYKMKQVLKLDGGEPCVIWIYLIPLTCTVKMAEMVNFTLCIFYHRKLGERGRRGKAGSRQSQIYYNSWNKAKHTSVPWLKPDQLPESDLSWLLALPSVLCLKLNNFLCLLHVYRRLKTHRPLYIIRWLC